MVFCATLFLLFFITFVCSDIFQNSGSYRLDEKHVIKTFTKHMSRLQCGQRCKYNDQCKSYSVNVALESCILYNVHGDHDQRRSLISDALWEFYEVKTEIDTICIKSPCTMGECSSLTEPPWYRCQCHKDFEGQYCNQTIYGSSTNPAKSCLKIKEKKPNATSAFYWITVNDTKFQVYCDMGVDGGGWIMITSIRENTQKSFKLYVTDNVTELKKMGSGEAVVLGAAGMKLLKEETDAKQLRIYCKKERTIHIVTKNNTKGYDVINYFSDVTNTVRPQACDSFDMLSDDDSILSRNCQQWNYRSNKWSQNDRVTSNTKLYDHPFYVPLEYHIVNNVLCDDQTGTVETNKTGIWRYYIR